MAGSRYREMGLQEVSEVEKEKRRMLAMKPA